MFLDKFSMLDFDFFEPVGWFLVFLLLIMAFFISTKSSKKNKSLHISDNQVARFTSDILKLLFYSHQIGKSAHVEIYQSPYCTVNNCDIEVNSRFSYELVKLLIDGAQKHLVIKCDRNGTMKYVGCYKTPFDDVWDENILKIGICERTKTFSIVCKGKTMDSLSPASSINIVKKILM
jgi:hypothetical protein